MAPFDSVNLGAYLCKATETVANTLMDAEASAIVNADYYQRSGQRTAYRNGYRARRWHTDAGVVVLHIPKLRSGSYYPEFLANEDEALHQFTALALAALRQPITPDAVIPLLTDQTDEATAQHAAEAFNTAAERYLNRRLKTTYTTLIVDADDDKIVIYGERLTGTRHLLDVRANAQGSAFWRAVMRDLMERGLTGIEAITGSGITPALEQAVREAFPHVDRQMSLSGEVVAALGLPFVQSAIDRNKPHALLTYEADAMLHIVIDGTTLVHLRRLMRDERDAIGVPLQLAA